MSDEKESRCMGSGYDDLLAFPDDPRRSASFQLGKLQVELDPDNRKPFDDVGAGTRKSHSGNQRHLPSEKRFALSFLELGFAPTEAKCLQAASRKQTNDTQLLK